MTRDDLILQTLQPVTHDLGGFKVHRTLPAKERTMVGPFLFFDQMGPAHLPTGEGIDVRPHPHINLATVTYLFDGAIDHRDSLGTFADDRARRGQPDDRGPRHSPFRTLAGCRTRAWPRTIGHPDLARAPPKRTRKWTPRSNMSAADDLPVIEAHGAKARIIMGDLWGHRAPTTTYAGTIYADILLEAGAAVPIDAAADERALYLATGEATLEGMPLEPQRLYVLKPGAAATLRSEKRRPRDALRRRRLRHPAPRLVEFRQLLPRPHQRSETRVDGGGVSNGAGGREGVDPDSRGAEDGELSVRLTRGVVAACAPLADVRARAQTRRMSSLYPPRRIPQGMILIGSVFIAGALAIAVGHFGFSVPVYNRNTGQPSSDVAVAILVLAFGGIGVLLTMAGSRNSSGGLTAPSQTEGQCERQLTTQSQSLRRASGDHCTLLQCLENQ